MTSARFTWLIAAVCLIVTSSTAAAAAPECPTPVAPYALSPECVRAISAAASGSTGTHQASEPQVAQSSGTDCPTPATPYAITYACAQAASTQWIVVAVDENTREPAAPPAESTP